MRIILSALCPLEGVKTLRLLLAITTVFGCWTGRGIAAGPGAAVGSSDAQGDAGESSVRRQGGRVADARGTADLEGTESQAMNERAELVMGTLGRVAVARGEDQPGVFEAAFEAFRGVDEAMSLYRPASELARVNAHAAEHAEPVGADLFALIVWARELSVETDGAFDVTVLPLLRAFGAYPQLGHLGMPQPVAVGFGGLRLDSGARTVRFGRSGMGLDLGGVAKGFALDRARSALAAHGVRRARLDLGGNLAFVGAGPGGEWRVAVRDPDAPERALGVLSLAPAAAVATSANYARDFAAEGWRVRSHIYDPRSWQPVRAPRAVTVWASEATTADALATAFLVLGRAGARSVLARRPEVGALFVEGTGEGRRVTLCGRAPLAWRAEETGDVTMRPVASAAMRGAARGERASEF